MFAFALYDITNKKLFCARDPFGIKPFYYYFHDNVFMFGSEIKSFLEHPDFHKEFNEDILSSYLSFSFTPTQQTFFKNVNRLDGGNYLIFCNNQLVIKSYFQFDFHIVNNDYDIVVDEISQVIKDSVDHHMISDVEVGSFLSSGIDSSYLVSLIRPNKTYTIGYDIARYNEIDYAKDLTHKLGINNTSIKISKEEYMKSLCTVLYYMDEPVSDPAIIPLFHLAKLASQDVKVVLSGEGADEFFGGYNYYRQDVDYSFYNRIPFCIRHFISQCFSIFPPYHGINFLVRRGERLEDNYIGVNKVWNENEIRYLLNIPITITNKQITKPIYNTFKNQNNINKMQAIDIYFWLMKDILHKADRMTMAHSLEARVPFVDIKVFHVASQLASEYKVTKENTKVALREAAKRVIPNESYKKKKLGFPVPIRDWMREDDVYNEIKHTFLTPISKKYFNTQYLIKLLNEHKQNKKDHYRKLWNVYCFIKWYYIYFE